MDYVSVWGFLDHYWDGIYNFDLPSYPIDGWAHYTLPKPHRARVYMGGKPINPWYVLHSPSFNFNLASCWSFEPSSTIIYIQRTIIDFEQ